MVGVFSESVSTLLASLPQYDLPECQAATNDWWSAIAKHMIRHGVSDVPQYLTRAEDGEALWRNPKLLFTQTCGYPLMTELTSVLQPVAVPNFVCEGCVDSLYASAFIVSANSSYVRLEDLRGTTAAVNNLNSQSGMNALRHSVAPLAQGGTFFGNVILSGGHALSVQAVAEGKADVAAIDAVTLALLQRYCPGACDGVRVIGWSRSVAGLPYAMRISEKADQVTRVQEALQDAADDPDFASAREALLIGTVTPIDWDAYRVHIEMLKEAEALSYPLVA